MDENKQDKMCLLKGTALIQTICQQALRTFSKDLPPALIKSNVNHLAGIITNLRAEDLGIDHAMLKADETFVNGLSTTRGSNAAPFCFVHVDENPLYSLSVFVARRGSYLPMHDHPGMHGVIKCLHGKIRIRCLEATRSSLEDLKTTQGRSKGIHARIAFDAFATPGSEPCILTPTENNFHQIWPVDGPAAFFDLLSPPYGRPPYIEGPDCHYFVEEPGHAGPDARILREIACPDDYWCEQGVYRGPPLYENINTAARLSMER